MNAEEKGTTRGYVGWSIHGLYVTGTASFFAGCYVLVRGVMENEENGIGAGVCWIATALSFGLLLNGVMRR